MKSILSSDDRGQITITWLTATAITLAIGLAGTVFGTQISSIKEDISDVKSVAAEAQTKANDSLIYSASIRTDIEWIKRAMQDNGIMPRK